MNEDVAQARVSDFCGSNSVEQFRAAMTWAAAQKVPPVVVIDVDIWTKALLVLCHDCVAAPGQPHVDGCDVARCTECGWQRISCQHGSADVGWGAIWTGRWPGEVEVEEGLASDLNDLAARAMSGLLVWNRVTQRFEAR